MEVGGVSSLDCQSRDCGFDSHRGRHKERIIMDTKDDYKELLNIDLIYFLVSAIITDKNDAIRQSDMIIDTWSERNKRMLHTAFKESLKQAEEKLEEEGIPIAIDEVQIITSIKEMAFNSIREKMVESLKSLMSRNLERNIKK